MFNILLNNEIRKLNLSGTPYDLEFGKFDLSEMHEVSENKNPIDLESSILIVNRVFFKGSLLNLQVPVNPDFVRLISHENNVDLSNCYETKFLKGERVELISEFPSIHKIRLEIKYNINNFLINELQNIHRASLEYAKIWIK